MTINQVSSFKALSDYSVCIFNNGTVHISYQNSRTGVSLCMTAEQAHMIAEHILNAAPMEIS